MRRGPAIPACLSCSVVLATVVFLAVHLLLHRSIDTYAVTPLDGDDILQHNAAPREIIYGSLPNDAVSKVLLTSRHHMLDAIRNALQDKHDVSVLREAVVEAMKHAWGAYKKHAWGADEVKPVSLRRSDGMSLAVTMVDSLDTLWIMGLREEFDECTRWLEENWSLDDKERVVSVFETTIRVLGGFLAAYELSDHPLYLRLAVDLGDRLLGAYNTMSGIPHADIHLRSLKASTPNWLSGRASLAEMGTVQLELVTLSRYTGDMKYAKAAMKILQAVKDVNPPSGILPVYFSQINGKPVRGRATMGALGDSFYEYLVKLWVLSGKKLHQIDELYAKSAQGILDHLVRRNPTTTMMVEMRTADDPKESNAIYKQDHLACFAGGMYALGAWHGAAKSARDQGQFLSLGRGITDTCYETYHMQPTGIAPEITKFNANMELFADPKASHYLLRPETVESLFVLYRVTGDRTYQSWGWEIFQAIETHCKVEGGYSGIKDVTRTPVIHDDRMESFFLGETLKYLYLLFSPVDVIPLDEYVFNTEAHPLRVFDIDDYPELKEVATLS